MKFSLLINMIDEIAGSKIIKARLELLKHLKKNGRL